MSSSSSFSMAATTAPVTSLIRNKFSNLSFSHSPFSLSYHLPSQNPKPLKLKTRNSNSLPFSLLPCSSHSLRCSSATFDSFQVSEDEQDEEAESSETEEQENSAEEDDEEEEDDDFEDGTDSGGEMGRLYVGNLPYSMTSSQLSEVFGEAGNVASVQIVYDRVTDRSRGFAFVTMGTNEEAKEAIRMFDGSQLGGRTVRVNFPEVPRGGEREVMGPMVRSGNRAFTDSPHKLYAGNLGWSVTSQSLRDVFADQPGVLSAKVIYDRNSGRSRGFGFVSFESEDDVQSALNAMNGVDLEGRPLRLNMASEKAPIGRPAESIAT